MSNGLTFEYVFTKLSGSMPNGYRKANFNFGPPPPSDRL